MLRIHCYIYDSPKYPSLPARPHRTTRRPGGLGMDGDQSQQQATVDATSNSKLRRCPPSWQCQWHTAFFIVETCVAIMLGMAWCRSPCRCTGCDNPEPGRFERTLICMTNETLVERKTVRRRLVANDFTADFSRRLSFHRWIEQDVVLNRVGFEQYLQRALEEARLSSSSRSHPARSRSKPQSVARRQQDLESAGFSFNAAFAAQEHHMLPGAPWSQGRDRFMLLVQHGLRPNHYYFSAGCGPFSTSGHVVRYLLTSRYYCIEQDEYLLRAAVEYEVPAAGLIHKRPTFLWNSDLDVGALKYKRPPGVSAPPSHFDFAVVQQQVGPIPLLCMFPNVSMIRACRCSYQGISSTKVSRQSHATCGRAAAVYSSKKLCLSCYSEDLGCSK